MFKKIAPIWIGLCALVLWGTASATTVNAPFYKIEKNGEVAYLLGTIHMGVNYSELSPTIHEAVMNSDAIILETDIAASASLIQKAFPMGTPNSLKDQLTEDEWNALYNQVLTIPNSGLMMMFLDRLHPAMAASLYQSAYIPATAEPIDQTIYEISQKEGIPFLYLEDPQIQVDALTLTQDINALKNVLSAPVAQLKQGMDMMVNIYKSGNEFMMEFIFVKNMSDQDKQVMLIDRNNHWVAQFDGIFNRPGIEFIAVGAAHLLADIGMVHLLEQKGYTLTRVQP